MRLARLAALVLLLPVLCLPATAQRGNRRVGAAIDVVQVNGLLDPSNAALIRSSLRHAEAAHSTASCSSWTRRARSMSTFPRYCATSRAPRSRPRCGSDRREAPRAARARCSRCRPTSPRSLRARTSVRSSPMSYDVRRRRSRRPSNWPAKPSPTRRTHCSCSSRRSTGKTVDGGQALHAAGHGYETLPESGRALPQARPHAAARAHAGLAVGRVLLVRRRPRADLVRVLHCGHRPRGRRSARSRCSARASVSRICPSRRGPSFLLLFGMFGLAIDLQAGGLGPWTFIGAGSLVAGSIWLYGGSSRLDPSWWVLVLVIGGTLLFMLSGMTAMVRFAFLDADDRPRGTRRRDGHG